MSEDRRLWFMYRFCKTKNIRNKTIYFPVVSKTNILSLMIYVTAIDKNIKIGKSSVCK